MHLHKSWILFASVLFLSLSAFSQDAQETAIKKTIADEEEAFFKRDAEAWKATWVQDDKVTRTFTNWSGSRVRVGWAKVSEGPLKYIKENPTPDSLNITTDSFFVRREGNMAVVDFKQHITSASTPPPFDKSASREQRVLIKKNGKWLIASASSVDITSTGPNGVELAINETGYNYIYAGKNDEAIKVLELNSQLFPNSFNVWDSLGEAYAKAGNKEKARECYEKSLAIYPTNESGKKALAELK